MTSWFEESDFASWRVRVRRAATTGAVLVLGATLSNVSAAASADRATRGERRALERAARALWPQLAPRAARVWSKAGPVGSWGPGTPDEFAARIISLVGDELEAQAGGTPPDLDRLVATIAVTFDAARSFANLGIHPVARAQRRAVFGVRAGLGALGLGSSALVYAGLDASLVTAHPVVLASVAFPSFVAWVMAHDLTSSTSLEPGVYFAGPRFERAYAEFLAVLNHDLPEHPVWRRVVPTESTELASRDLASLMRYVWTPGLMRVACDHWFSTDPARSRPEPARAASEIAQSDQVQIATNGKDLFPWPPGDELPSRK